MSSGSP